MCVAPIVTCITVLLEHRSRAPVFCFYCMLLLVLILVLFPHVLGYLCVLGIVFFKLLLKELEV